MPIDRYTGKRTRIPGIKALDDGRHLVRVVRRDRGRRRETRAIVDGTLADAVAVQEGMREDCSPRTKSTRPRLLNYGLSWLRAHSVRLAPSTAERYAGAMAKVCGGGLGAMYIDALRPGDVREWLAEAARAVAPSTANGWLRVLRQCLDAAVADGLLAGNPARAVKALRETRASGRRAVSLDPDQFRALVTACQSPPPGVAEDLARLILCLAWTGMRMGEALALRWTDRQAGMLRVERSVWRGAEKETKTDDPRIVVEVDPLRDVLDAQRRWLVETEHPGLFSGLVFPADPHRARAGATRRGGTVRWWRSTSCTAKPLRRLARTAGLPELSNHALRRTWEDLLRRAGVGDLVRRSLAGWRSEKAQAIYAGVSDEERARAGAAVVRLVAPKSGTRPKSTDRATRATKKKGP